MDTKSLAKSKRAHSQHLSKKHHPNPKSKPQQSSNPSDANSKKPPGKQIAEKPRKPALPSNWDRYQEEFDSQAVSIDGGTSKASDVVVPKSKGADFAYLISEAQSQLQSQTSARFASFDDVLPDFNPGMSSMLSVRGNGILSWVGNDNFIVDDNSATSDEAAFLSMDLHSLASRLEKLDVSRRLFIEEDILPPQLNVDGSKETVEPASEQEEKCASGATERCLDEFAFFKHSNAEKSIHHSSMVMPSTATSSYTPLTSPHQGVVQVDQGRAAMPSTRSGSSIQSFSREETSLVNPVKNDSIQIERSIVDEVVGSIARFNVNHAEDSREGKPSMFEALAAEAELDMLLNSFGEIKLPDTSGISKKPANTIPIALWDDPTTLSERNSTKQPSGQGSNSSRNVLVNVDIDDTIDDLLRETSSIKNHIAVTPQKVVVPPYVPASSSNTTDLLDGFDSWLDTI